jgi:hypothetical protein
MVSVTIGDRRMDLRLKSGRQFHRQSSAFRLIARGEAIAGEAAIYPRGTALMVKLVAWLPRGEAQQSHRRTARVHCSRASAGGGQRER